MARNRSDIFNLRDPEDSSNDGTQMFSVNGSCSLKLNRKDTNTGETFQYNGGGGKDGQGDMKSEMMDGKKIDEPKRIVEEVQEIRAPAVPSGITRNPLTGTGMETEENINHQQKKFFKNKNVKWQW